MALVACPVAAIGTEAKHDLGRARAAFPEPIEDGVHYSGWHVESSYGAAGDHFGGGNDGRQAMRREVCWYDWDEQQRSMRRLAEFPFEWVLSGHGPFVKLDSAPVFSTFCCE